MRAKINTFMFDLDGTLLPMDVDKFIELYFHEMGDKFKDLIHPKTLVEYVWTATREMIRNLEYRTNEEVFMEKFSALVQGDIHEYQRRFDEFYDTSFSKVKNAVSHSPIVQESIGILKDKGYQLVIATNPLFPRKAIYERIKWAGLDPKDFMYISSYEQNHYCKPHLEFFQEVLKEIGKKPEECMMVGNDVEEDMVAGRMGIQTFLITDYMIRSSSQEIKATYQGTYEDFRNFVLQLETIR